MADGLCRVRDEKSKGQGEKSADTHESERVAPGRFIARRGARRGERKCLSAQSAHAAHGVNMVCSPTQILRCPTFGAYEEFRPVALATNDIQPGAGGPQGFGNCAVLGVGGPQGFGNGAVLGAVGGAALLYLDAPLSPPPSPLIEELAASYRGACTREYI